MSIWLLCIRHAKYQGAENYAAAVAHNPDELQNRAELNLNANTSLLIN
jgi:hypothetical protein